MSPSRRAKLVVFGGVFLAFGGVASAGDAARVARQLLADSGVSGGLVVHVGCGDGELTAALHASDSFMVQGLDRDPARVAAARKRIRSLGLYGKVTAELWKGDRLPYIDNLANLLVVENGQGLGAAEMMRVLRPGGIALVETNGTWRRTAKPWPADIDEWTHFLYDATGNAVSKDKVVGPPRHVQWTGGPRWARHHDHMASLNAMVSANGRVFYVMDEGPKASIQWPPEWYLVARDAFNGVVLWKRRIPKWWPHLYPLKAGPTLVTRRLVATDDLVFATLSLDAPLSALDAATGKMLRTYGGTEATEEVIWSDGVLFLVVNPKWRDIDYGEQQAHCWRESGRANRTWGWSGQEKVVVAIEARTGKTLWRKRSPVAPVTLAADGRGAYFCDGQRVVAVERVSGEQRWASEPLPCVSLVPTGYTPRLAVRDGVVVFTGRKGSLVALSADTGKKLWTGKLPSSGHFCPEDVFVIGERVWGGAIASARNSGVFTGWDLHSGKVARQFPPDVSRRYFPMHQRCYPSKATERWIIPSRIGVEFIDPRTGHWVAQNWVRGACVYGVMPANGLLYATPHNCACYYQSKLAGLYALAPARKLPSDPESTRLERGPAYGRVAPSAASGASDWPTYRHDPARSGHTPTVVPPRVIKAWEARLGGKLTSPVVAGGKVFVASVEDHRVVALDAASGKAAWAYVAGGRVDSPPTFHRGVVLFGCADGWVYCLRATDGALVWRFRAAPADLRLVSYGQVESAWPLHGTVLVHKGVAYALAGRSVFLDGGLRLVRLDPLSGRKLSENVLDEKDPKTGKNLQSLIAAKKMPVALPDVLSCDGRYVYMRSQRFDLDGRRAVVAPENERDQDGEGIHLFCPIGFLDGSWFHRAYWIYGKNAGEGWGTWFIPGRLVPYGRIMVVGEEAVYGYARDPEYLCNASVFEYRLFSARPRTTAERRTRVLRARPNATVDWTVRAKLPPELRTAVDYNWLVAHPPLLARAMVLAGPTLFVAGPPDVVDEKKAFGHYLEPKVRVSLSRETESWGGRLGAVLWAVDAASGKKLAETRLTSPPVWDGMGAAGGRLYLATMDGRVVCLAGAK